MAWYIRAGYGKCKIVRTCDFCDRNPLKGFKINSRLITKEITCTDNFTFYVEQQ